MAKAELSQSTQQTQPDGLSRCPAASGATVPADGGAPSVVVLLAGAGLAGLAGCILGAFGAGGRPMPTTLESRGIEEGASAGPAELDGDVKAIRAGVDLLVAAQKRRTQEQKDKHKHRAKKVRPFRPALVLVILFLRPSFLRRHKQINTRSDRLRWYSRRTPADPLLSPAVRQEQNLNEV